MFLSPPTHTYGCGQDDVQLCMAAPHFLGHVVNLSRQLLASEMKEKHASNGCRKIHNPDAKPATGHAMKINNNIHNNA